MNLQAIIAALTAAATTVGSPLAQDVAGVLGTVITNLPDIEKAGEAILAGGEAALGPAEDAIKAFVGLGSGDPTNAQWQEALAAVDTNSASIQAASDD